MRSFVARTGDGPPEGGHHERRAGYDRKVMTLGPFEGVNAGYVVELYERYRQNPESVDPATREAFQSWTPSELEALAGPKGPALPGPKGPALPDPKGPAAHAAHPADVTTPNDVRVVVGATNLVASIRRFGHLAARLDPLGSEPPGDPSLSPRAHGITDDDLKTLPPSLVGGPVAENSSNAYEAIEKLRRIYCSTTGFDISHVFVPEERTWLRHAFESGRFLPPMDPGSALELIDRITQVDVFERFLHRTFPGKTRFSIEGVDMLVPILDSLIAGAATHGARHTIIGMAHRGRLNVLAHILEKPYAQILAEFKDPVAADALRIDLGWMGDVKYHAGASTTGPVGHTYVTMPPNPSHLEAVDPVVVGMARAAGTVADRPGPPRFDGVLTLPILIHGDAAFPGQGIVAETLNLSRLSGYDTAGTIHIIANNQLGFTATPDESYSTSYASGLARGFKIPIVHVNADDPAACLEAARLAWEYRARFGLDFLIDLIGYRRFGHNEGDEPAFTQPLMYRRIATHKTVRELFADQLAEQGTVPREESERLVKKYFTELEQAFASLKPEEDYVPPVSELAPAGTAAKTETGVAVERLREINESCWRRLKASRSTRSSNAAASGGEAIFNNPTDRTVDWGAAEELAFATILADGIPIRLTGEDVERGTFSSRHAVFYDAANGSRFVPLQSFNDSHASFEIHNSPLSRKRHRWLRVRLQHPGAVAPRHLGSAVRRLHQRCADHPRPIRDVARAKWGLRPSLVFLLPHGYEGQGPEHSSAQTGANSRGSSGDQSAARELHDGGAVLPSAAPASQASPEGPAPAVRAHAEEPAAPSRRCLSTD